MSRSFFITPGSAHHDISSHPSVREAFQRHGVLFAGSASLKGPFWVHRHHAKHHVFLLTLRGRGQLGMASPPLHLPPESWAVTPELTEHRYSSKLRWDKLFFHLDPGRWAVPPGPHGTFLIGKARHGRELEWLMNLMLRESGREESARDALLPALAEALCLLLRREWFPEHERVHPDREALEKIQSAIRQNPSQSWNLRRMAALFPRPISPNHFHKICVRHLGQGPHAMLRRIRMELAVSLMAHTPMSLEQVGAMVGYANAYSFSVACRRQTGQSPSRLRKAASGR